MKVTSVLQIKIINIWTVLWIYENNMYFVRVQLLTSIHKLYIIMSFKLHYLLMFFVCLICFILKMWPHYYCLCLYLGTSPIVISGCCVIWCLYRKSLLNLDWSGALGNDSNCVLVCLKLFLLVCILFLLVLKK